MVASNCYLANFDARLSLAPPIGFGCTTLTLLHSFRKKSD
jgi:hypothetical protein